jgi:antitoxin HicB
LDIPAVESLGATREETLEDLDAVKREWFSYALDNGIKIPEPNPLYTDAGSWSGRVTLRIPKSLHRRIAEYAQIEGISLNSYLNMAIERGIFHS